ncbi:MAG: hypothetical protein JJU11_04040 [Candidatus Sumerlaeia bacterium]|nr:hypothetical protein [Candidatus Sumerlaeia bacterium]
MSVRAIFYTSLAVFLLGVVGMQLARYPEVRAHVQRRDVRDQMNRMQMAINFFKQNHGRYPGMIPFEKGDTPTDIWERSGAEGYFSIDPEDFTSEFLDPFSPGRKYPLTFYSNDHGWMIVSPGPDREYRIKPWEVLNEEFDPTSLDMIMNTYDPTNGTRSPGNIWLHELNKEPMEPFDA